MSSAESADDGDVSARGAPSVRSVGGEVSGEDRRAGSYARDGWVSLPGFLPAEWAAFFTRYVATLQECDGLQRDPQVPGSLAAYGDAAFDTLLRSCATAVSEVVGRALAPTYSFVRLHTAGAELVAHQDRPACEHSATIHLGGDRPWPFFVTDLHGVTHSLDCARGDAVLYAGPRVQHWREPFDGTWYVQLFLHYVEVHGPAASRRFDERPALGSRRQPGLWDPSSPLG